MGQQYPLKLGSRPQDANLEDPMRTPKLLYAQQRLIYQPELPTCPHCGEVLVMCNYLTWDKTVQTLDQVLSVASRPGRCPHETCPGSHLRLMSAQAQSIASPGSTYGYDVLVRIGWLRSPEDLAQERQRFAQHRERFRLQSRSTRQTQIQFAQLRQRWAALPPTGTG